MLVKPHKLFAEAFNMQYALGAFNVSNLELTQAVIGAAEETRSPVIVQTSEGALSYAGIKVMAALIKEAAAETNVPVVLHLDHGKSLDLIKNCIEAGFTSVMIDASKHVFEENISLTKEVVKYAHDRGVWVEAELGTILGAEGAQKLSGSPSPEALMTKPKEARHFVQETEVDALAVSVGTIHGAFTGQEYIRFELIEEIEKELPETPLVIHGASGIAAPHLKEVATTNVCKVNVDTELRIAFERAVKAYFDVSHDSVDPRILLGGAREAVQKVVEEKIRLFGSAGRVRM